MKIPFDIKFRPQIERGEYKVITRKDRPAKILCWNYRHDDFPIIAQFIDEDGQELCDSFSTQGRLLECSECSDDLFLITPEPEPELTEFEKKVCEILYSDKPEYSASDDDSWKRASAELLELAKRTLPTKYKFSSDMNGFAYGTGYEAGKEEVLKELKESLAFNDIFRVPEWLRELLVTTKENGKKEALNDLPRWRKKKEGFGYYCDTAGCLVCDGYEISIQALKEKLPGFKED